jgi:homoserine dehydrogenase
MTDEGMAFKDVLEEAQKLGYAEVDPAYDIEGTDTAHKLAILSTLAFSTKVELSDIFIEGITKISPVDIHFAKEFGYAIKLLAISRENPKGLELRVHPTMIPAGHLLAQVKGAYNAFYVIGNASGKILLYGLGAGQMPTGSAVVSDIVDIARDYARNKTDSFNPFSKIFENLSPLKKCPMEALTGRYYFRFSAMDSPGVLARIAGILGEYGISIDSVIQKGRSREESVPVVMLTHEAKEEAIVKAVTKIDKLDIMTDKTVIFRIFDPASIEE